MHRSLALFACGTAVGAIIVGAVASEAASWLITSPNQIKPGVISLRNLSLSTRRALRGTAGQRGPAGPAGLRGPKGDSGQAVIADGSVSTGKLADGAVTDTKLADGAVTSAKIAGGTISEANMATDSVGSLELKANAVWPGAIQDFSITARKLQGHYVTGDGGVLHGNVTAAQNGSTIGVASAAGIGRVTVQCSVGHSIIGWENTSTGNEQDAMGTSGTSYGSVDPPGGGRLIDYGNAAGVLHFTAHDIASGADVAGEASVFKDGGGNCIATAVFTIMWS